MKQYTFKMNEQDHNNIYNVLESLASHNWTTDKEQHEIAHLGVKLGQKPFTLTIDEYLDLKKCFKRKFILYILPFQVKVLLQETLDALEDQKRILDKKYKDENPNFVMKIFLRLFAK